MFLRDWSVDTMFTARSATPVNVTISRDLGFGSIPVRPDLVAGIPLYLTDPTVPEGQRFNNTVVSTNQRGPFLIPATARQGTLGRNALRGFPIWQLDLALRRQFNLSERVNLQLRAEFFNIFNHPNFGDPPGSLASVSSTGVITYQSAFGVSSAMLGRSLGSGGVSGGFNPLYQVGGPRSIQLAVRLQF
jgi:hypothetical protein